MSAVKDLHRQAMQEADLAHEARREGNATAACAHFEEALRLERGAAEELGDRLNAEPTRSILFRSAATLAVNCGEYAEAEKLVCRALAGNPPETIAEELRDLYEQVTFRRHLSLRGITLSEDEVQMSFSGRGVGHGIAPTEEVLERVDRAQTMLYRTAERKLDRPYREHGQPTKDVKEAVALYMTVPRAASFAVSFVVGGRQPDLPGISIAESIVDEAIECLDLFIKGEEEALHQRIPDTSYFTNFVGLANAIAPDGDQVEMVGFTAMRRGQERQVALKPKQPKAPPPGEGTGDTEETKKKPADITSVTGQLKYADAGLEHSHDLIRLIDDAGGKHTVVVPPGMMTDIVRPLWGSRVLVTGSLRRGQILLERIERAKE
ncbi:MAG: hypothetical protein ACM336_15150 [Acidobacteriota bacterium]